jgi:PAS domain-containing protein
MVAGAVWTACDAVSWAPVPWNVAVAAVRLGGLGAVGLPLTLLLFSIDLGRVLRRPGVSAVVMLAAIPATGVVADLVAADTGGLWGGFAPWDVGGHARVAGVPGAWYGVQAGYAGVLVAVALVLLLVARARAVPPGRAALDWSLAGLALPLGAAVVDALGVLRAPGGVAPFVLGLAAVMLARGLWGEQVGDRPETWSTTATEHVPDPVLVVDAEQRVRFANGPALELLGRRTGGLMRADARAVFREHPGVLALLEDDEAGEADVVLARAVAGRSFRVSVAPFRTRRGRLAGRVLRLQDIATEVEARGRLAPLRAAEAAAGAAAAGLAALAGAPDAPLEDRLERVLEHACAAVDTPHGRLYRLSPDGTLQVAVADQGRLAAAGAAPVPRGEGAVGRAWSDEGPLLVGDFGRWEARGSDPGDGWIGSLAALPVWAAGRVEGALLVARGADANAPLGATELAALRPFGQLAGLALERERLADRGRVAIAERNQLVQITAAAAAGRGGALEGAVTWMARVAGVTRVVVWRVQPATSTLEPVAWAGVDAGPEARSAAPVAALPVLAEVARTRRELVFDAQAALPQRFRATGVWAASPLAPGRGAAVFPLLRRERCVGVVAAERSTDDDPSALDALRRGAVAVTLALLLAPPPERAPEASGGPPVGVR